MPSDRLYYDDAYTTRFRARVTERGAFEGRPAIELERTYFYPESGGQLGDRGTLEGVPVEDVQAGDDGRVWHLVGTSPVADEIAGDVDWTRRFDHMQQHTGQHVLSAAFERVLEATTLSSTLGAEHSVIEVGLAEVDWRTLERIELAANQVLWEDRALVLHWSDAEGVKRFPLRKPPKVEGRIRVVEIPEWDWSACGGTHTRRTGEVGVVKIVRWEKVRGNVRFEFLCGARALRDHAWRTEMLLEAARRRTLKDRELIAHLERAAEERDELKKRLADLTERTIAAEARARVGDPPQGVAHFSPSRTREDTRRFAIQCLEAGAPWVAAGAAAPDPLLIVGRAKPLGFDVRTLVPGLIALARGKGGGSPELVQIAAADAASAEAAWNEAAQAIARAVAPGEGA